MFFYRIIYKITVMDKQNELSDLQIIYDKHAKKLSNLKVNRAMDFDKMTDSEASLLDGQITLLADILSDLYRNILIKKRQNG